MYCWLCLLFFLASTVNAKSSEVEPKQIMSSAFLVLMAFFLAYVQPVLIAMNQP